MKNLDGNKIEYGSSQIPFVTNIKEFVFENEASIIDENEYKIIMKSKNNTISYDYFNNNNERVLERPTKKVEKYWGHMTTIIDHDNISVKKIFMKQNSQSSMEYHIQKKESYLIEDGELKVGFRVGRAQNKSLVMKKGDIVTIPIGLMHMRMALKDTVILEISTPDDDSDSHLVEDGKKYVYQED